jgi:glyoxylase-like metal-dependent hydrolase (beta-lactamase superfamily II)
MEFLMRKNRPELKILIEGAKYPQFHTTVSLITVARHNKRILFDTGFSYDQELLVNRLAANNLLPDHIDYIIFSHWHIDHCGSLSLFRNAHLILSLESLEMIKRAIKGIKEAEESGLPQVEYLKNYIANNLMSQEIIDDIGYSSSKIRAMANIVYRNKFLWIEILNRYQDGRVTVIEDREMYLFNDLKIVKRSAHTKGDLILNFLDENGINHLIVGDIIPFQNENSGELPMLTEDKQNFEKALTDIRVKGSVIVPGHDVKFICN